MKLSSFADRHVERLFGDAELNSTVEGTNEINMLVVGCQITGINAFR